MRPINEIKVDMSLLRTLNGHEELVAEQLEAVKQMDGARIFAKIRVADVIHVDENTPKLIRGFALTSHFDFLITDSEFHPLFVVEYDGPTHNNPRQVARDKKKDEMCEKALLPILHINSRYLNKSYRNQLSLLEWVRDVFFLTKGFDEAQSRGEIPPDEGFSAGFILSGSLESLNDPKQRLPYQLALMERLNLQNLQKRGVIKDSIVSCSVGRDKSGNLRALGAIRIDDTSCICARTAMRSQNFPIDFSELIEELLVVDAYKELKLALADQRRRLEVSKMKEIFNQFRKEVSVFSSSSSGDFNRNPLLKF